MQTTHPLSVKADAGLEAIQRHDLMTEAPALLDSESIVGLDERVRSAHAPFSALSVRLNVGSTDDVWRDRSIGLQRDYLLALGHFLIYGHSAEDPWDVFGEDGRIEVAQVALLVLGLLLSVRMANRREASRPLSILLAGFLAAMIVREHNNYFKDHVGDNVWQALVTVVLVATLAIAWRWRRNLGASLKALVAEQLIYEKDKL